MSPILTLLVLRCSDVEKSAQFYRALGLPMIREQHGGPIHYSATVGSTVLELYPAGDSRGRVRLALQVPVPAHQSNLSMTTSRDPDGNTVEVSTRSATKPDCDVDTAALEEAVAEAHGLFVGELQPRGRRWPAAAFRKLCQAVESYVKATADSEVIHRSVAYAVNGLRELVEMAPRVPADAALQADRLESMVFSGYDPYFEGNEPPDL